MEYRNHRKAVDLEGPVYASYKAFYDRAWNAGVEAAKTTIPNPMIITGYGPIADGVCGFAWVNLKGANRGFPKWVKASGRGRTDDYYGGVTIWISDYNQSMERKLAHARAMAKVLKDGGVDASYNSRMD